MKKIVASIILGALISSCDSEKEKEISKDTELKSDSSNVSTKELVSTTYEYEAETAFGEKTFKLVNTGTKENGGFLLKIYNKTANDTLNFNGETNGKIIKSWVTDMDNDQNSELNLFTLSEGSGSYGDFITYELENNKDLKKITLPKLTPEQMDGYRGNDKFNLKMGKWEVTREFPVYKTTDDNASPTNGNRIIIYIFKDNNWIVKE